MLITTENKTIHKDILVRVVDRRDPDSKFDIGVEASGPCSVALESTAHKWCRKLEQYASELAKGLGMEDPFDDHQEEKLTPRSIAGHPGTVIRTHQYDTTQKWENGEPVYFDKHRNLFSALPFASDDTQNILIAKAEVWKAPSADDPELVISFAAAHFGHLLACALTPGQGYGK